MSTNTYKALKTCAIAFALLIGISPYQTHGGESEGKKQPVYGTCTPTNSGGQFQAAICLLKQLCPTCDFGTLSKNNVKVVVRNKEVDSLYITTDRQQSYGLISAAGKVEARVMFGAIIDLCLGESRNVTLGGNTLDEQECVTVAWEGKSREFVYPPKFEELFRGAKFKLKCGNLEMRLQDLDSLYVKS